ncbi:MAG: hypothetical protein EA427_15725 [Spirochaetaceae bacterium]|nr:MAG: hypothetical protein EA427_15725 [Spirochaetaceae bacterium]
MVVPPVIEDEGGLPLVPALLAGTGEEFCLSRRVDADMIGRCCQLGYLPMADEYLGTSLLLIKCHRKRMVLRFPRVHVSRGTRRRLRREPFFLALDGQFEAVMAETSRHHEESWLTPALGAALLELHRNPRHGVSVHSVELTGPEGDLVAAELGYRCGGAYTSLSGFHRRSGTGMIQMVALAFLLRRAGFAFWDLGMDIPYKRDLGARPVERAAFLEEYRRVAAEAPPGFPGEPVDCRELVPGAGTGAAPV